jgi:hypothetical protein
VELQSIHYDGQTLSGRFLVSAQEHDLHLDKRLIESISLTTEAVSECATGRAIPFILLDVYAPRLREEDVLILKPGHWYGKDVRIPLFTESISEQFKPTCIDVEFAFRAPGGKAAASLRVRAVRPPEESPDAGVQPDSLNATPQPAPPP